MRTCGQLVRASSNVNRLKVTKLRLNSAQLNLRSTSLDRSQVTHLLQILAPQGKVKHHDNFTQLLKSLESNI